MQPLVSATFAGRFPDSVRFDFESGWQCRIFVLADDLIRVLFLRNGALKEPRTWMVAPGSVDVPWEGRDRLDVTGFSRPAFGFTERAGEITLATAKLSVAVTLQPFGVRWSTSDKVFAADRSTYSYQWSERSGVVRLWDIARKDPVPETIPKERALNAGFLHQISCSLIDFLR